MFQDTSDKDSIDASDQAEKEVKQDVNNSEGYEDNLSTCEGDTRDQNNSSENDKSDHDEQEPQESVEALKFELHNLKEEMHNEKLRFLAEVKNIKNIHDREVSESRDSAIIQSWRLIIQEIDNLEMALQSCNDKKDSIYVGLDMVLRNLRKAMSDIGITEVVSEIHSSLNPNNHEALYQEDKDDDKCISGHIKKVIQKGYVLNNERLIRPAKVITYK